MKETFNDLKPAEQHEMCIQFMNLYPHSGLSNIKEAFKRINPLVEFEEKTHTYNVWEAHRSAFEKILTELEK